jgi:hypothetical protein
MPLDNYTLMFLAGILAGIGVGILVHTVPDAWHAAQSLITKRLDATIDDTETLPR